MNGKEIVESYEKKFGERILEARIDQNGKIKYDVVWLKIDREVLVDAIKHLFEFGTPHFSVISASDFGDRIELVYELTVGWGKRAGEVLVNFKVDLPYDDRTVHTICSVIPGALISEREKQELFGVKVRGIPDKRNFFLPDGFKGFPGIKADERVTKLEVE